MHDAAPKYEPDTFVVDVDDVPAPAPRIARGRVVTEELVVQVKLFDLWHRRFPDADRTACGVPFKAFGTEVRREVLTHTGGKLCPHCFTAFELDHAIANDTRARAEAEKRQQREDIDSLFKALPRTRRPSSQGDR